MKRKPLIIGKRTGVDLKARRGIFEGGKSAQKRGLLAGTIVHSLTTSHDTHSTGRILAGQPAGTMFYRSRRPPSLANAMLGVLNLQATK